ncbi:hypothetical protein V1525DRAFT_189852 [Lipomyces kononenkoae]|uniref:Uncharacterized protein n=1 Tax=Lipomyces kononenkoae TaxID=34357 RepID=A0ACC3SZP2_LIPKO
MSSSHDDSGSGVRDHNDDNIDDIEDGQEEIASVAMHGSVSQMRRGLGNARQHTTPSVTIANVDNTDDTLVPLAELSSQTDATPQDDRMRAEVLAGNKIDEKEESPVTGESSSARNTPHSNGNPGFGKSGRPGIVRKTKPPPIYIERTMKIDRLSIASIGDLVKRARSSFRGAAAESHAQRRATEQAHSRLPIDTDKHASRGMLAPGRQSRTPVSPDGYDQPPATTARNRNRVFGLPWWCFTLLAIGTIIIIVVCTVVPIQLTSHNSSQQTATPSPSTGPSQSATATLHGSVTVAAAPMAASASAVSLTASECQSILPCENNGVSVVRNNSCACICVGDFGGNVCGNVSNAACAIVTLPGSEPSRNVTLGTSIAPLLLNTTAQLFPSVELDAGIIFDVFNSSGVSCASQNALVTFNGVSRRHRRDLARHDTGEHGDYNLHLEKSSDSGASDASFNVTDMVLSFARVVVLDVAQTNRSVEDAVTIQQSLQEAFTDNQIDPKTGYFNTGSGIWVNFMSFTVGGIFGLNK